ncbi:MAG TPA: NAD(P)-dependent oxidoreductase [Stellaceae bacterium]|nr:NAD(P)-dependent oxidoreductase [Stellaceae bacterium]
MILAITFKPTDAERRIVAEVVGDLAEACYLTDFDESGRRDILSRADVVLARNTGKELRPEELKLVGKARLIQFLSAGLDHIPVSQLPGNVPIAKNAGAYADPMAEHALAMALAAAKRLLIEHRNLLRGEFNQFTPNKMLHGRICGIFGFGGIGAATARLMRCVGMRIHAVNRRGATDERVDWIGTPDRLDELVAVSDVLIISAPLTSATQRAIGQRQLSLMKDDAILINLARGEIVDEDALYEHLKAKPRFTACLDAWWIEPVRHGEFRMNRPFLELPNVIGSPHNSASVADASAVALRYGLANCRRALMGEAPLNPLKPDERMR